ncbi:hypothetical protein [Nostoc sp.]
MQIYILKGSANRRQATFTSSIRRDRKRFVTIKFINTQFNPTLNV